MKITVIGTGYVGLVTGAGLADFGWEVTCADIDSKKIEKLNKGKMPFYEPGLESLVKKNLKEKRLSFTDNVSNAIKNSYAIFITVGTPSKSNGLTDLTCVYTTAKMIGDSLNGNKLVVIKSTVPVGTTRKMHKLIWEKSVNNFDIAFNPEFLREGSAVHDFFHPDRVIVGAEKSNAFEILKEIYRPLYLIQTPFLFTNIETAELIKYAANSFLAMKVAFINEIADLCEKVGANVHDVSKALGLDGRIGPKFLHPGPGYGGSCFPKDTKSFAVTAREYGSPLTLIEATIRANEEHKNRMVKKIERMLGGELKGKIIGILGLAFKPETDDMRESPTITIIEKLLEKGAVIRAYDPKAMENAKKIFGDKIEYCENEYQLAKDLNILVIATEWNQFRALDLGKIKNLMKDKIIADLRNALDPKAVKDNEFIYEGVGRK